jgi:hypothetical protein
MFSKLLFSVSFLIFTLSSIAQEKTAHHVGTSAGMTTGFGLSYRYWPSKLGFQLTALPTIIQDNGSLTSFGASALYSINDGGKIDLYGYFGNSIIYSKGSFSSDIIYNSGIGFGLKLDIFDDLNINTQFGYGGIDLTNKNQARFTFIGEFGLYYHI